ncbi:MAG TPA: pyruvoyl-dependent arginine decarboxylase [Patescibacteria group bacterium]|nr:pyruvoyl-dependent arginine decarboxylase [Patescibacteria group bacterium]
MDISKSHLKVKIVKGKGEARTPLSAFDAALKDAGVFNYNLIVLSSIIPPGSSVEKIAKYESPEAEYGHRLYVVLAEERSSETGKFIAAGIGWYLFKNGKGIFVEHHLTGDTEVAVESEIKFRIEESIKDMCEFRDIEFNKDKMNMETSITQVQNHPASVLVIAVYLSEVWK